MQSLPGEEGKIMADELKEEVDVEIIPDSFAGKILKQCDFAVAGSDSFNHERFVNKTGTFILAVLCEYLSKPFVVASSSYKYADSLLTVRNIFEITPMNMVNYFIWEKDVKGVCDELFEEIRERVENINFPEGNYL
jgi:translation initiation factor 2B subunit (eIF-2B alpha/beta/delta family)